MKAILSGVCAILAVSIVPEARPATWYVDGSVVKPGDGTSWEKALKRIQAGIDKASDADMVIVAQGTYVENINFKGKNMILRSTDPTNWGVVANTVIDGNRSGSVVRFAGTENETCVLSGFTIRNGSGTLILGATGATGLAGGGIMGGGDWGSPIAQATIQNNIITANTADGGGGGICSCRGLIQNNIIMANTGGVGGAIVSCPAFIQNNLIAGNSAGQGGALFDCGAHLRNSIVVGNSASQTAGGLHHVGMPLYDPPGGSITNCIIWGNTAPTAPQLSYCVPPTYSFIQDWTEGGEGNRSGDPQFVDPDGPDDDPDTLDDNNYRLLANSPCIDTGVNEDWMNAAVDLDGRPRILLGASSITVDMGAYEYRFDLAIARNTESKLELSWTMRPQKSYTVLSSFDMMVQPWVEETTILGGKIGGPASWIDPAASAALKFYKIEVE